MKVFNGKVAAEQYMSMHTLAYSTPETILRKFAYWLGDLVDIDCDLQAEKCPNEDGMHPKHRVPRLMLYLEKKDIPYTPGPEEVDESAFRPSGAVSGLYTRLGVMKEEPREARRFCHECGAEISRGARFCPQCGAEQKS